MSASARGPRTAKPKSSVTTSGVTSEIGASGVPSPREASDVGPRILSFEQVVASYKGEWILWKVAAFEGGWPSHGEVLAHSPSRPRILEAWRDAVGSRTSDELYYVFPARLDVRTGAEVREALELLQETWEGEVPSVSGRW